MKIAIYHGFQNFHFEMIGYVLDYLITFNYDFSLYSHCNIFSFHWMKFYNELFNKYKIIWNNPNNFDSNNYDYVFLLTDDDFSFITNNKIKIICIEHVDYIRRLHVYLRIGTRFFHNRPECLWALPSFQVLTINEKLNILQNENKINVAVLGKNQPNSFNLLKNLFINFSDINFYLIGKEIDNVKEIFKYNDNVKIYNNCLTIIMLNILKKCHYVLCLDIFKSEHYTKQAISASIPLSFSFGCQLIIPQHWQIYYNFKSIISYETNELLLSKNINLDYIYEEQNDLISHRNNMFNKCLI